MTKSLRPTPDALLDPKVDPIFKALFTQNSKNAKFSLEAFLSAILDEKISNVEINQNELPIESEKDKQSAFDITCHIGDENKVLNIEMQGWNSNSTFDNRSEYHVAHLLNHFVKKGMDWNEIPQAYMISVLNFIYEDNIQNQNSTILKYSMKNEFFQDLHSKKLNIIYVELPKFHKIHDENDDPTNLTSIQRWAKFFLYANNASKKEYINQLCQLEEGIMYAQTTLNQISQEEREWFRERNYWDAISTEKTIRNHAIKQGHQEGLQQGLQQGLQEGIQQGIQSSQNQIVINMYKLHYTIEQISEVALISIDEIKKILGKE